MENKASKKLLCVLIDSGVKTLESSIDAIYSPGYYKIEGDNLTGSEGFPNEVGKGRVSAYLEVSDTNKRGLPLKKFATGQTLSITDKNGVTMVYCRKCVYNNGVGTWSEWQSTSNIITNIDFVSSSSIDQITQEGRYCGVILDKNSTEPPFVHGARFVLTVYNNDSAMSILDLKYCISCVQILAILPPSADISVGTDYAKLYIRTGKKHRTQDYFVFGNWQSIASSIVSDTNNIENELVKITDQISSLGNVLNKKVEYEIATPGYYETYTHNTVGEVAQTKLTTNATALETMRCLKIDVLPGMVVHVRTSKGTVYTRPVFITDENEILLFMENEGVAVDADYIIPEKGRYLYVNLVMSSAPSNAGVTLHYNSLQSINYKIHEIHANRHPLIGKRVLALGDSISEFKYKDMTVSDYFELYSGAEVINCAVGGSMLSMRAEVASVNDLNNRNYYSGTDLPAIINALVTKDYSIIETSVGLEKDISNDDNTEILERIKGVDLNTVDIVTIFAGTNDWGNAANIGTSDDTSYVNNVCGAIKHITKKLLSAYPHLSLYFFTPVPRFTNKNDEATWCDINNNSKGLCLSDYSQAIIDECKRNHVLCCDLYWGMGWNIYNYKNYLTDNENSNDGTHPYRGLAHIASRQIAFIESHLTTVRQYVKPVTFVPL